MKTPNSDIFLRPRFQLHLNTSKEIVLTKFEKNKKPTFLVKQIDDHIFIKFEQGLRTFWTPELHLELHEEDNSSCKIKGLFGPSPSLWTFFMFLHFGVATLFIVIGIWAYSNWALHKPFGLQMGILVILVVVWGLLYAFGRTGRKKGEPQMKELYTFMSEVISP
ncbi:GTP-binding protein [Flavobacteriaceae bacterium KMM 6897]|nr:GTP-binding protein [Flavobacteriaceae bacterium KMM 6897]MEB8345765.1 GTP-binding protein [Flavobacteriaceae bacterium KMM 6898]